MSVNLAPEQLQLDEPDQRGHRGDRQVGHRPVHARHRDDGARAPARHRTDVGRLEALKELGVSLAVDDFGTGFSALSYLQNFPIDTLKIAKPFLDGMPADKETALVRGIVELGHNLELDVVAEGVERREQWELLRTMNCDLVQGYLLARPQGAGRIEQLLEGVRTARARGDGSGILSPEALLGLNTAA